MGERRLARLSDAFPLQVERVFTEIHPDTPALGMPIERLGYPPELWSRMMESLERMGQAENIRFARRSFTTNSHRALLLAEAARIIDPGAFEELNERLFRAYFSEGRNIGDERVLRQIASESGLSAESVGRAWDDAAFEERLGAQRRVASALGVTGIPTFLIGDIFLLEGAVPLEMLIDAVKRVRSGRRQEDLP